MSKYTTNFYNLINKGFVTRERIENCFKSYELTDYLTQEEIDVINDRSTWNKEKLASLIVDNFMFREIGFETYAMFEHYAKVEMNKIMESKLPLIYSSSIKYDPLINVDYHETLTSESADSGLVVSSDTPQGNIDKQDILSGEYASSTAGNESSATSSYDKHIIGNSGVSATAQAMVKQYRDNIRAINEEIIEELSKRDLFFGLF